MNTGASKDTEKMEDVERDDSDSSSDEFQSIGRNSSAGSLFDILNPKTSVNLNWGKLAWNSPNLDDSHSEDGIIYLQNEARSCLTSVRRILRTAISTPSIWISTVLAFSALLAAGLTTVFALDRAYSNELRNEAVSTATELGTFISNQLDQALLPLFAMSQFVKHLDDFKQLPYEIGARGETGAAPALVGKEISHRNVSGICDDQHLTGIFHDLAANIKKDAGMEGILVNLQLAPASVVCLLHPLVNTEDFDQGLVMNNTGAVGHDLLNDPNRVAIARATVPAEGVVIAGPLSLIQGDTPLVKEAFIARLAINMEGYKIVVDGIEYPCWGFAVILLNWAALKEKSGLDEMFEREGLEYRLTRTDTKINTTTGEEYQEVASIAESKNSDSLDSDNSVSVDLDTTNDIWEMAVGYEEGFSAPWHEGLIALVVIVSFLVSILIMTVLVANREKQQFLYKMMPPKVVKKLQRGETVVQKCDVATVFFSDVVGFTELSSQLSPIDVMDMLNEMYSAFDLLVEKHKLYKVETVGDAYMVVAGVPDNTMGGRVGAENMALFALDAIDACKHIRAKNKALVCIRAGLASGPVVAGVIGNIMPKFSLFGDTVNTAARMESTSTTMRVQCSEMTYRLLNNAQSHAFDLEKRVDDDGSSGVFAKGKGKVSTWFVNGCRAKLADLDASNKDSKGLLDLDVSV